MKNIMKKIIKKNKGASLVELMVGLTIGTLIGIATYSTSVFFTKESRSGSSLNNVFQEGMNGIYLLSHDLRQAGLGAGSSTAACPTINAYYNGTVLSNNEINAPVIITSGGTTGPDSLTLRYSNSILGGLAAAQILSPMPNSSSVTKVVSTTNVNVGDLILIAAPGSNSPCTLVSVTKVQPTGFGTDVDHNKSNPYNPSNPSSAYSNSPSYPTGSIIFNYGTYTWRSYSVVNNILTLTDKLKTTSYSLIDDIVDLKAQYGVTDGVTSSLNAWVAPTGVWDAATLDSSHVQRIRATHVAMLLRSPQKIKPAVAGVCDATSALPKTWTGGPTFNTPTNADWKCYKYRALDVVVPIKNVIYATN